MGQYEVAMLFSFSMGYAFAAANVVLIVWIKNRRNK